MITATAAANTKVRQLHKEAINHLKAIEKIIGLVVAALVQNNESFRPEVSKINAKVLRAVLKLYTGKGLTDYSLMIRASRDVLRLSELSVKEHMRAEGISMTPSKSRELVPA